MPRNGQGQYVLPPLNPVVPDTIIATAWANGTLDDMALALSTSISTDGQTPPTANLPMAGFRHTTVGAALANNQYTRADQTQAFAFNILGTVTVDPTFTEYAGTLPLGSGSTTAFTNLQPLLWVPPTNNSGPCTLQINLGGLYPIVDLYGKPLDANVLVANRPVFIVWRGGTWVLVTNTLDVQQLNLLYLKLTGGTLTGPLLLSEMPNADMEAATKKYVDDAIIGGTAGVASFNTRSGAVTLLSSDVLVALGYTPLNTAGGTLTGPLTGTTATFDNVTMKQNILTARVAGSITGAQAINFAANQTQVLTLTGTPTFSLSGLTVGNIGRIVLLATNTGVPVWPGTVLWPQPLGTAPDFTLGPAKKAVITLEWDGTNYLANASVY